MFWLFLLVAIAALVAGLLTAAKWLFIITVVILVFGMIRVFLRPAGRDVRTY